LHDRRFEEWLGYFSWAGTSKHDSSHRAKIRNEHHGSLHVSDRFLSVCKELDGHVHPPHPVERSQEALSRLLCFVSGVLVMVDRINGCCRDRMCCRRFYVRRHEHTVWRTGQLHPCPETRILADDRQGRKWALIAAFDAATELILIAIPVMIVWPLRLPFYLKAQVSTAFAFRLG
jgi:hypothetical protein